jgi:hypothetical protein
LKQKRTTQQSSGHTPGIIPTRSDDEKIGATQLDIRTPANFDTRWTAREISRGDDRKPAGRHTAISPPTAAPPG